MAKSAGIYVRMDPQIKKEAEALYSQYGMNLTQAINIFIHQSLNIGGLPFSLRPQTPNAETTAAMQEGDKIIKAGKARFDNAEDLLRELKE